MGMTVPNPPSSATPAPKPKRGRPRKDPAQSDVRAKLIRQGLIHLTERGYSSVGVDEILKASGVPKGSFYHYFKNKADFGHSLIDAYNGFFLDRLDRAFGQSEHTPLEQLSGFVAESIAGMAQYDFKRGCLVGNLGQEMGALPEDFRAQLIEVLEGWQARTAECLRRAQAAGEISAQSDPNQLASFFWIGWEGAVLRAKLERGADPLTEFTTHFFAFIKP